MVQNALRMALPGINKLSWHMLFNRIIKTKKYKTLNYFLHQWIQIVKSIISCLLFQQLLTSSLPHFCRSVNAWVLHSAKSFYSFFGILKEEIKNKFLQSYPSHHRACNSSGFPPIFLRIFLSDDVATNYLTIR